MIALGVRDRSSWGAEIRRFYYRWVIYLLVFGLDPVFATDNAAHIGGPGGRIRDLAISPARPAIRNRGALLAGGSLESLCALTAFSFFKMFMALVAVKAQ